MTLDGSEAGPGLKAGQIFSKQFRIERPLGEGGMGAVYAAEQLSTGRVRALKLLRPVLASDPGQRERFLREARAASGVPSEHIIEVIDAGVDEASGTPWLAMELLEGETLAELLEHEPVLPPSRLAILFEQLGHGLAAAHAAGLIHRDIKPENIYLAAPRSPGLPFSVKVLDFGIAKLLDEVNVGGNTLSVGSPLWMAPEQGAPGSVSPAADVWALGLVAFRCLTGRWFWLTASAATPSLSALITEIMTREIPPATVRARELGFAGPLPAGLDGWLARCLEREPSARFPEAGACVRALLPLLRGGETGLEETLPPTSATPALAETLPPGSLAPPTGRGTAQAGPARSPRRRGALLGVIAVVALGAGGALAWWGLRPAPRPSVLVLDAGARASATAARDARPPRAADRAAPTRADARATKRRAGERPARASAMGPAERRYFEKVVLFCWHAANEPPRRGKAHIRLTVAPNGHIARIDIREPAGDMSFRKCVVTWSARPYFEGPGRVVTIRGPLPAVPASR